ncbi:MAG TPA: T9SS type A sorting domain-containing protein [Bacteroidia bacterium]|nr:T9SS type A sorting domain-containing protein [Bacteroidia bacterium]HNU33671.1 T9SS type A sorting domain-containing protein [Bacteroidia bacterium]
MKKKLLFFVCLLLVHIVCAQKYYDSPYPITATQTFNGSQYRIECSVYDSSLATTLYYNTAYYDEINTFIVNSINSIAVFASEVHAPAYSYAGCIAYDFEIHQWKTYIDQKPVSSVFFSMSGAYTSGNIVVLHIWNDYLQNDITYYIGYYDIIHHNFQIASSYANSNGSVSFDGLYGGFGLGNDDRELYMSDFKSGSFISMGYVFSCTPGVDDGFDELTSCVYDVGCGYELDVSAFDAETGNLGFYYSHDASYIRSNGMYLVNDYKGDIHFKKYDAAYHTWVSDTLAGINISGWAIGQNVFALKDNVNHFVICGVYNFNQHCWILDSVSTPAITSLAVTNGTVTWNDGSGIRSRGYDQVTGWGNYNTTLTPIFYVSDVSQVSGGNLIFIRDYSIGATNYRINYGDGKTGTRNDWHLYKKNGSYQYQGLPLSDTICYTVYSSVDSATTCVPVNCFKPIPVISTSQQYLCAGDSALLTVATGGISYQWLQNNSPLAGATNSTCQVFTPGNYQCLVTDICGVKYSNQLNLQSLSIPPNLIISTTTQGPFCSIGNNLQLQANLQLPLTNYIWMHDTVLLTTTTNNNSGIISSPASGSYYCIVANTCGTDTSSFLFLNVGQTPSASLNTNGGVGFCNGDSLLLSVPPCTNCSFEWTNNGNVIPNAFDSLFYAKISGIYSCKVTDTISGCNSTSGNLTIYSFTMPVATLTSNKPDTICSNAAGVTLSVGTLVYGNNYIWRKNGVPLGVSNSPTYNLVATSDTYDCIISNPCGADTSNAITFTIFNTPQPSATTTATSFCPNDSVLLTVTSGNGFIYQWKKSGFTLQGATLNTYYAKAIGLYSCVVTNMICSATSNQINILTTGVPNTYIIPLGPTTFCSPNTVTLQSNLASNTTYQWVKNGVQLTGATSATFIASNTGNYQVINTNIFGCDSTSAPISVNVPCAIDIGEVYNGYYPGRIINTGISTVYPNPMQQKLFVETNTIVVGKATLIILDVLGKLVAQSLLYNNEGNNLHELFVGDLKPGVYFIELKNEEGVQVFKVIRE